MPEPVRRAVVDDPPGVERDDPVRSAEAALEPVLAEQHGHTPFLVEPPQEPDQLIAGDRVVIRGDTRRRRVSGQDVPDDSNADPDFGSNMEFGNSTLADLRLDLAPSAVPAITDLPAAVGGQFDTVFNPSTPMERGNLTESIILNAYIQL